VRQRCCEARAANHFGGTAPRQRIEETEQLFSQVEEVIRRTIPADELSLVLDSISLPVGGINLAFSANSTIGPLDGKILV
jgi:hypothetical protein